MRAAQGVHFFILNVFTLIVMRKRGLKILHTVTTL